MTILALRVQIVSSITSGGVVAQAQPIDYQPIALLDVVAAAADVVHLLHCHHLSAVAF